MMITILSVFAAVELRRWLALIVGYVLLIVRLVGNFQHRNHFYSDGLMR
jgi:hypothetical protein